MMDPNALMNGNSETKWGEKDKARKKQPPKLKAFIPVQRTASSAGNIKQKHEKQNILSEDRS